MAYKIQIGGL